MAEEKKKIENTHEHSASKFLINLHSFGSLRDKSDLVNAVYHSKVTLDFVKDIILNFEGSFEQKVEFVEKVILDLDKFTVNE